MAKIYPVYADKENSLVVRADKKGLWTLIHWNDGSTSWRRVYYKAGKQLVYNKGISYEMVEDEITKRNSFVKSEAQIPVNFTEYEEVEEETTEAEVVEINENDLDHPMKKYIKSLIESNTPVYLVGEAGTGKSYTLHAIADELGLDFHYTNSVQDEFKLNGFIDAAGDYHDTEFYKAFVNGGLFFLDELDASIPGVLVLLNTAIANGFHEFPNGMKMVNENFRVVAAGNTFGNGADEKYTGRLVLDQSSLDRFAVIEFDYFRGIEMQLAEGNKDLVDFIEGVRAKAKESGIRATFSYRAIQMVTKMEKMNFPMDLIFKSAVFKGLDLDTVRMLMDRYSENRYYKAMAKVYA